MYIVEYIPTWVHLGRTRLGGRRVKLIIVKGPDPREVGPRCSEKFTIVKRVGFMHFAI